MRYRPPPNVPNHNMPSRVAVIAQMSLLSSSGRVAWLKWRKPLREASSTLRPWPSTLTQIRLPASTKTVCTKLPGKPDASPGLC